MLLDEDRDYVEPHEAARRMGISVGQLMELVRIRALRSVDLGLGVLLVEPAITNVTPTQ